MNRSHEACFQIQLIVHGPDEHGQCHWTGCVGDTFTESLRFAGPPQPTPQLAEDDARAWLSARSDRLLARARRHNQRQRGRARATRRSTAA